MPNFWARSDIHRCKKLDNSSSKAVRSELEWLVYSVVLAIGFHSKHANDSSNRIMMLPKFWSQSETNRGKKLDNSSSQVVISELEWLVYCVVLAVGFHSKLNKCLLPTYYDEAQV
ncbi:hypothetical protein ACE6H2_023100 [Prunus campanulata]